MRTQDFFFNYVFTSTFVDSGAFNKGNGVGMFLDHFSSFSALQKEKNILNLIYYMDCFLMV